VKRASLDMELARYRDKGLMISRENKMMETGFEGRKL